MRYIDHGRGGPPSCLHLARGPQPVPRYGEVLIEVAYAGINRPDILQRTGQYPPPEDASPILGLEVSGHIIAAGPGAESWTPGTPVTALVPGGGYAEYCVTPSGQVLPVPHGMDLAAAAALPETWFTVWANLVDLAGLSRDEYLLVHGGASGIGLAALALGHLRGARCLAVAGSDEKAAFCREWGAELAINRHTTDFVQAVFDATRGEGVDVILDIAGAPYFDRNLKLLRRDGRLVFLAFMGGSQGMVDLAPIMRKRLHLTGSTMRPRTVPEKRAIRDALLAHVWPELAHGRFHPHIHARFPLQEAASAHMLMETGNHIGKIVLEVAPTHA